MQSEQYRQAKVAELKTVLKDSTLKVLGYNIDGSGYAGIFTECTSCGKVSKRPFGYWVKYPNCYCRRSTNIAKTLMESTASTYVKDIRKASRAKPLTPYLGKGKPMTVECLQCSKVWTVQHCDSLFRGHGCRACAAERIRKNNLRLYGVEHATQRPEIRQKMSDTMVERFGVPHALQNRKILDKALDANFDLKDYKLGKRVVRVQGYEPQALDYIRKHFKVKASDIQCGRDAKLPSVKYRHRGKLTVYHPDIWIQSLNRLCEVKSIYTYLKDFERNQAKRLACEAQGYSFTFFVMDRNGNRLSTKDLDRRARSDSVQSRKLKARRR